MARKNKSKQNRAPTMPEQNNTSKDNPAAEPVVPAAHKEMFKKFFLKETDTDAKEFFNRESTKLREALPELVSRLRQDEIEASLIYFGLQLYNAAENFKTCPHIFPNHCFYKCLSDRFKELAEILSEEKYDELLTSMAAELQSIFQSNGLMCEVVARRAGDLGDRLSVIDTLKFLLEYNQDSVTAAAKPLTGLEGKCSVCLDEDTKLFALTPCGHTVCLDCTSDFIGKECPTCKQHVLGKQGVFPN